MASLNTNLQTLKQLDLNTDKVELTDHINSVLSGYISKGKYVTCEDIIKFAIKENLSVKCLMCICNATNDHKDKIDRTTLFAEIKKKMNINQFIDIEKIILNNK